MKITLKKRYGKYTVIVDGMPKGFKNMRDALSYIFYLRENN